MLASDPDALDAFRVANRAVAAALRRRLGDRERQLAGRSSSRSSCSTCRGSPTRPIATARPSSCCSSRPAAARPRRISAWRRSRWSCAACANPGPAWPGAGVSVIMRYTLRLLTLDQLARAAGLVCALELERAGLPERYGAWPFEIGLWVGKAATPNLHRQARATGDRTRRAPRFAGSRTSREPIRRRSRSRSARGAASGSRPTRSRCGPTTTTRASCGSSARTSTATSTATGRCRSSPSTSRSTGGCRRS